MPEGQFSFAISGNRAEISVVRAVFPERGSGERARKAVGTLPEPPDEPILRRWAQPEVTNSLKQDIERRDGSAETRPFEALGRKRDQPYIRHVVQCKDSSAFHPLFSTLGLVPQSSLWNTLVLLMPVI
jgi:hypothetical protein